MNFLIAALSTETSPLGADKNFLDWWKAKKEEYPTLARMYLCVPGTSTQAERVFSCMGLLLNKRRLSKSVKTLSIS